MHRYQGKVEFVRSTSVVNEPSHLKAKLTVDGKVAVRFECACALASPAAI